MRILISVGHTLKGKGVGATGYLNESNENRVLGKKVVEYLKTEGHEVDYHEVNESSNYLNLQTQFANAKNYDLVVQIHFNAGGGVGCEVLYRSSKGKEYALRVANSLGKLYKNRGVKHDKNDVGRDLNWLRETKACAILIETCFVDTKSDADKYKDNVDYTAKLIAEGILNKSIGKPTPSTSKPKYIVATEAFNDINNARKEVEKLKSKGINAYIHECK